MAKQRTVIADFLVYVSVRAAVAFLQALSFPSACRFADGLAWLAYRIDRRHRLVADENLRYAFPALDAAERDRTIRAVYRHFCTLVIEIVFMPRAVHVTNWKRHLRIPSSRKLLEVLLSGRPVLVVTGHFGNWEITGYAMGLLGFPPHAIARPFDNPFVDDYLRRFRERTGQKILAKKGDFDQMQHVLASGGMLATLADQDAGQRGLFVDFFGRPASTHKAVALMALEHGVVMVVGGAARVGGPLCYQSFIEDVIDPKEYRDRPDAVRALTERFTASLERVVRQHPEQYFWLHRRWKHRPVVRKGPQAA